jgi:lipopolysaccharide export system permease LptF/LptG-like protein
MTRPGTRFRATVQRLCGTTAMERLVDPAIADLQHEYEAAVRRGLIWRSRWILVGGCAACAKVAAAAIIIRALRAPIVADDRAVVRTLVFSVAAVLLLNEVFMWPPLALARRGAPGLTTLLLSLVPQAVAVALPLGLVFGVLLGLRNRPVTAQVKRTIARLGLACTVAAFVLVALVMPAANQRFRELAAPSGMPGPLARGYNELTLDELAAGDPSVLGRTINVDPHRLAFEFQCRLALAFAPLALSLLALGVAANRRKERGPIPISLVALMIGCGYYVLMYESREAWMSDRAPALIAGWTPNLACVVSALLLRLRRRGRSGGAPSRHDGGPRSADQPAAPPA